MDLESLLALGPPLAALLIALAGASLVFGARKAGKWFFLVAIAVVVLPVIAEELGSLNVEWRAWLPDYVDERVFIYGLYAAGFLVAMNVLRHVLALFVGYGAANSAVGDLLASVVASVLAVIIWPFRAVRNVVRRLRPWDGDS